MADFQSRFDSVFGALDALKPCASPTSPPPPPDDGARRQQQQTKQRKNTCRDFSLRGYCRFGDRCRFAHGSRNDTSGSGSGGGGRRTYTHYSLGEEGATNDRANASIAAHAVAAAAAARRGAVRAAVTTTGSKCEQATEGGSCGDAAARAAAPAVAAARQPNLARPLIRCGEQRQSGTDSCELGTRGTLAGRAQRVDRGALFGAALRQLGTGAGRAAGRVAGRASSCAAASAAEPTTVPRSAVHFGTCYVGSRKKAETHKRAAVGAAAGSRKKRKAVAPVITISFDDDSVVADDE